MVGSAHPMKLRKELIAKYLRLLTRGRAVNMPDPMSAPENFDADIRTMRRQAQLDGNLDWLRLALDSLINQPRGRIQQFAGLQYPFTDEELVRIFTRAYAMIWPDVPRSELGDELELEFVDISAEDWALTSQPGTEPSR